MPVNNAEIWLNLNYFLNTRYLALFLIFLKLVRLFNMLTQIHNALLGLQFIYLQYKETNFYNKNGVGSKLYFVFTRVSCLENPKHKFLKDNFNQKLLYCDISMYVRKQYSQCLGKCAVLYFSEIRIHFENLIQNALASQLAAQLQCFGISK